MECVLEFSSFGDYIHTHTFRHGKASKTHPRLVTSSNEENSFKLGHAVFSPFFYTNFAIFSFHFFFFTLFLFLLIKHVNQETIFFFLKEEKNEEHIDVGRRFDQQLWSHSGGVGENFSNYYCIHKIIHTSVIKTLASEHTCTQRLYYFLAKH